jgi:hypothetical protein
VSIRAKSFGLHASGHFNTVGGRRTVLTKRDWLDSWLVSLTVDVAPKEPAR